MFPSSRQCIGNAFEECSGRMQRVRRSGRFNIISDGANLGPTDSAAAFILDSYLCGDQRAEAEADEECTSTSSGTTPAKRSRSTP
jgi:hypothetical protein